MGGAETISAFTDEQQLKQMNANMIADIFPQRLFVASHLMDPKHFAKQVLNSIEIRRPHPRNKIKRTNGADWAQINILET